MRAVQTKIQAVKSRALLLVRMFNESADLRLAQ
jgi:hypothetical protein